MTPHLPHLHLHMPKQTLMFKLSMWWRIFYGFLRIILGISLLKVIGQPLSEFIHTILSHEITGKTSDAILEHIYTFFEIHNFTATYFVSGYFIFWGIIDIALSFFLLKHIKAAFPVTMGLITLFIIYSAYRFTFTHSFVLLGVIIIDLVILALINAEYKKLKATTGDTSTLSDPLPRQT
jgi:uncharacterized membrane protein